MAHYILTDAHEEADRLHAMLEKILFSVNDKLEGESTYKLYVPLGSSTLIVAADTICRLKRLLVFDWKI